MDTLYEKLGYIVRQYRKEKALSTHQLAAKLNVSSGLINNIENSKNDVFKLDLLVNLLTELNIPIKDILSSEFITINDASSPNEVEKLETVLFYNNLKNIDHIHKYILDIANSLLEIILRFEDKDTSAKIICEYIMENLNNLKKILTIK